MCADFATIPPNSTGPYVGLGLHVFFCLMFSFESTVRRRPQNAGGSLNENSKKSEILRLSRAQVANRRVANLNRDAPKMHRLEVFRFRVLHRSCAVDERQLIFAEFLEQSHKFRRFSNRETMHVRLHPWPESSRIEPTLIGYFGHVDKVSNASPERFLTSTCIAM